MRSHVLHTIIEAVFQHALPNNVLQILKVWSTKFRNIDPPSNNMDFTEQDFPI